MSNFVILRHFLGAGPDGDDLGALLRRSTTWWTPWAASWTGCHEGYKAMSNFVILRHFLGASPDGDDRGTS